MPKPHTQRADASQATGESAVQLSPGLYIVATPIGNLRDITLRALDVLGSVDRLLVEDTRQTAKLLNAFALSVPMDAYHDHNATQRIPQIMEWLAAGETLALVSDAGTPLVSDPGFKLVRAAHEAGHAVFPVPGASAAITALSVAGLPSDQFFFAGFLPPKSAARTARLGTLRDVPGTLIFYETGPRLAAALTDMKAILGDREACIARELTKTYEELRRGPISTLIPDSPPKGEIVVLLAPGEARNWSEDDIDTALRARLHQPAKIASREVAELSGWARRDVYARFQALKP